MAIVTRNDYIGANVFILKAKLAQEDLPPAPGQFYMIRTWQKEPLLSRPISVFDYDRTNHCVYFMYQVVGRGTDKLCHVAVGSDIQLDGPYGNGFIDVKTDLVLIGGGIGIAPLYYEARMFKKMHPDRKLRAYLGFTHTSFGTDFFHNICDEVSVKIGGYITDSIEIHPNETIITCGPQPMLDVLNRIIPKENTVYESLESRMACGLGACLGCVKDAPLIYKEKKSSDLNELIFVANKHVKICTDGPVFKREVI